MCCGCTCPAAHIFAGQSLLDSVEIWSHVLGHWLDVGDDKWFPFGREIDGERKQSSRLTDDGCIPQRLVQLNSTLDAALLNLEGEHGWCVLLKLDVAPERLTSCAPSHRPRRASPREPIAMSHAQAVARPVRGQGRLHGSGVRSALRAYLDGVLE